MKKDVSLPFDESRAEQLAQEFGTPLYVYDEKAIRATAQNLTKAFKWSKGYRNYFAVKANPNPAILSILHEEGMGFDCSSYAELAIMERLKITGSDIFYTSNNTPKEDFRYALKLGATINIDDLTQVPVFIDALAGGQIERVALRYNPGELKQGNAIIGKPTEAKYGMSIEQLVEAYKVLSSYNIKQFGLHTMVASNELEPSYFAETARIILNARQQIFDQAGVRLSFINLGGGIGVNYRTDQPPFDLAKASTEIKGVFGELKDQIELCTENGRYVTGPHGYLLTRVRYNMSKYKKYIGVDASMHNLMRPGMYGAYHHITALVDREGQGLYDVVGSLCENNDKFAIDRQLPDVASGDLLVIHDAGAHGYAMGFNYNGLLKCPEVLLGLYGNAKLIRRAETIDDYLTTVIWPEL
jgi:diaminopimelate decarboxylase